MGELSEQLNDLSLRTKRTEDVIEAAMARNRERLQAQLDALTAAVDAQQPRPGQPARPRRREQTTQSMSQELHSAVDDHFAVVRDKAKQHHAEHDLRRAEHHADTAEQDAAVAVDFARYALEQSDYAIIEAAIARADADELAAQSAARLCAAADPAA